MNSEVRVKLKDKIRDKLRLWLLEDDLFQVETAKKTYKDAMETWKDYDISIHKDRLLFLDMIITVVSLRLAMII